MNALARGTQQNVTGDPRPGPCVEIANESLQVDTLRRIERRCDRQKKAAQSVWRQRGLCRILDVEMCHRVNFALAFGPLAITLLDTRECCQPYLCTI